MLKSSTPVGKSSVIMNQDTKIIHSLLSDSRNGSTQKNPLRQENQLFGVFNRDPSEIGKILIRPKSPLFPQFLRWNEPQKAQKGQAVPINSLQPESPVLFERIGTNNNMKSGHPVISLF